MQNKTFTGILDHHNGLSRFNACVGRNGADIKAYEEGFHESVITLLSCLIKEPQYHSVDTLIYPIIYCARHRIELFLKERIKLLEDIHKIKKTDYELKKKLQTHSLKKLWDYFEKLSDVDRRLKTHIISLNKYILDYFKIDSTGQVFRYFFDNNENQHLSETEHINIVIFESQYKSMDIEMEKFDNLIEVIKEEYFYNTYTKYLSRAEIREISLKLPNISTWHEISSKVVMKQIKSEYQIKSNREFDRVIDLIKNHKEFSYNIGYNLKIQEISRDVYYLIKAIYYANENITLNSFIINSNSILNKYNTAALRAFFYIGKNKKYSEEYDYYLKRFKCDTTHTEALIEILCKDNCFTHIENGIKTCGQHHLIL